MATVWKNILLMLFPWLSPALSFPATLSAYPSAPSPRACQWKLSTSTMYAGMHPQMLQSQQIKEDRQEHL